MGRTRTYRVSRRAVSKRRRNFTKRVNKRVKKTRSRRVKRTNRLRRSGRRNYKGGGFPNYNMIEIMITELFEKNVFGKGKGGNLDNYRCFIAGMIRAGVPDRTLMDFFKDMGEMAELSAFASNLNSFVEYMIGIGIKKGWFVGDLNDTKAKLKVIWTEANRTDKIARMDIPTKLVHLPKLILLGSILKHQGKLDIGGNIENVLEL